MAPRTIPVFFHAFMCGLVLCLLLLPGQGRAHDRHVAAAYPDAGGAQLNARFQFLLDAAVRKGLSGVSLRVIGAGIDFAGAAGFANLATGEPLTVNHSIYTASLGKTFTAVIALQLYAEGRLDLDAPLSRWLPDDVARRIPSSDRITLRHLLSHTSGLIDYMNDQQAWRSVFASDPRRHWTHCAVAAYIYDRPLRFEPGTDFDYSNSNYVLAGLVIERVTGQPLQGLIRERILAPLGLQRTFSGAEHAGRVQRAHGYIVRRGRIMDTYPWYSHYGLADSGIQATPADLAVFLRSLFGSEKLLSEAMRRQMTRVPAAGQPPAGYGLGIYVQHNPWGAGCTRRQREPGSRR